MSKRKFKWSTATDEEKRAVLKALGIEWAHQLNPEALLPQRGLHLYEECTLGMGCICGLEPNE